MKAEYWVQETVNNYYRGSGFRKKTKVQIEPVRGVLCEFSNCLNAVCGVQETEQLLKGFRFVVQGKNKGQN